MTSLVTGATGFVGRNLVSHLAGQGRAVRALYRDERKGRALLGHGEETILGDACDPVTIQRAVAGVDVIYHCAAAHSTSAADEIRRTNLASVRSLFEAIRASGARPRVILMSSLNVLGIRSYADATESLPRRRTNDLHVDLKIEAEELAERWIADGLDIVILRPGLIYGPGDPHLPKLAQAVRPGKFVFIGSRDNVVPLVYVSDMVQAMMLAADSQRAAGRTYNITDGSRTTIGELVGHLARVLDCEVPKRVLPTVVPRVANSLCGLLGRAGPISPSALRFLGTSRHVDIRRAEEELGFHPQVPVAQGVPAMADWLREELSAASAA
jgi:nucleoside-diphosphate-sugar epimerase